MSPAPESLVERVKRLAEKATEGPWLQEPKCFVVHQGNPDDNGFGVYLNIADTSRAVRYSPRKMLPEEQRFANTEFIAAARTDAPRLCDLVEELATALGECLQEHGGFTIAGECERRARAALEKVKSP